MIETSDRKWTACFVAAWLGVELICCPQAVLGQKSLPPLDSLVVRRPPRHAPPPLRPPSKVTFDQLGRRQLARWGFLDVTAAPFRADPTGQRDSTAAIQAAIDFARLHQLVCFFPSGEYRVSDTLVCEQYRPLKRNGKQRYGTRDYPCVLVGSRVGPRRPRIVLAPHSPGFEDPQHPKYVIRFWAPGAGREAAIDQLQPNISMNQMLIGIDVVVGEGNPGAVAIRHRAAQGSGVQDCTIDVRHGFCGLEGGAGSGGSHANVTILGGRIGLDLRETQPAPTVTGFTLIGQRDVAIVCAGRQAATIVGTVIVKETPGPAVVTRKNWGAHSGQLCLIDSRIEFRNVPKAVAVWAESGLYLRNVYVRGAKTLIRQSGQPALQAPTSAGRASRQDDWVVIEEYAGTATQSIRARRWDGRVYTYPSVIYVDGKRLDRPTLARMKSGIEPPADLQSRHLWDKDFPHWQLETAVNVRQAPYNAAGDGKTDDTAALQRAIDEHRVVFVPKGTYAISRTLRLRPDTQLIGAHRCFTWFQPIAVPGGDFADRARPRPVIETADDGEAQTVLAFLGIRTLTDSQAAYCLRWRSGRKSIFRDVNIHFSFRAKPQGLKLPTDAAELARLYNQPLVLVEGNGGGRWYNFHQESSRGHGPDYRHLLIHGTREPLRLYHCNPEHARSRANLEIREARNVRLYGVKGEYYRPIVWIRDSDQVAVFGYGGNAAAAPGTALFVVENTPNFVLANLVDSPRFPSGQPETFFAGDGVDPRQWFMVRETAPDGRQLHTAPLERPVLYKRGRLGDELAGPR